MLADDIKGQDVLWLIEFPMYCCTAVPLHVVTALMGPIIAHPGLGE